MKKLLLTALILGGSITASFGQLRMPSPDVTTSRRTSYRIEPAIEKKATQVAIVLGVEFLASVVISRTDQREKYYGASRALFIGTAIGGSFYIFNGNGRKKR